jgi:hypothetical protein
MGKKVKPVVIQCECGCGEEHLYVLTPTYDVGVSYFVCGNCLIGLVNHSLSKKQFKNLLKGGHDRGEYLLHESFYDEKGRAVQPFYG